MRLYYRGPDAAVTSEALVWRGAPTRTFAIRDMRNVGIARRVAERPGHRLLAALLLVGVTAAAVVTTPWVLALAPLLGPLIVRRRSVTWELRADCAGRPVTLYASGDARVFNQVTRALRRAIEERGPATWHDAA